MSLPKAVREQEAKAEALYEETYTQQNPESEPTPEARPDPEPEVEPNGLQPEPAAQEEEPDLQAPPDEPVGSHDEWEHRYKVLSGKYNSEVPRLAADNRELRSALKKMESEIESLKKSPPSKRDSLLKPEEIEEYGEGFIDVVRRAAREEIAAKDAEIDDLKQRIESLSSMTTKTVEIDFYEDLGRMVPEWVAINDDKNFHRWLDGVDELTGRPRQMLLSEAEADRDAKRVANFFNAFKKANKTWAATANASLESQVVPEPSVKPSSPPAKRIWTRAEINNFYADYRRGAIEDKRAVALEADIQAALIEGRVR